jgi:hypothetical protein
MSTGPDLRIGVTGHRVIALAPVMLERLRDAIDGTFSALAQGAADITHQAVANGDRHGLQVVSALAEGADRMVAAAGLAHGAALVAVLPFCRDAYLRDFPEEQSRHDFMRLLAEAAEVIELDGHITSDESRNAAYSAVGEAVVSRSDAIFALWDGRPPNGPGGTSEIVDYARRCGCPVLWFKLDHDGEVAAEPTLLLTQQAITGSAVAALIAHLKKKPT